MKFFACFFALVAFACVASADKSDMKSGLVGASYGRPAPSYGSPAPSIAALTCPKNWLFSCQPNLAPVPCAAGGYAGAYSEYIPQYAYPQYAGVVPTY